MHNELRRRGSHLAPIGRALAPARRVGLDSGAPHLSMSARSGTGRPRFNVVAANLDRDGVAEADRIASVLRDEGWPRATRSLVIREALTLLTEQLADKPPD